MNAAAAANTGWQRAASHSNSGNSKAIGTTVAHATRGRKTTSALSHRYRQRVPGQPSTASFGGGGLRTAAPIPISSGATVTMPSASDANQCCQMVKLGAVENVEQLEPQSSNRPRRWRIARTAAASNPRTWRSRSRLKPEPNWRSIRPAASNASPALHKAKVTAPAKVLSPNRLATIVAAPLRLRLAIWHRGPSAIRAPAATPEAGQKTATPSGFVSRERPSRAPRKKAMPTATATPIAVTHCRAGSATTRRGSTRLPLNGGLPGIPVLPHQSTTGNLQLERGNTWQCPLWVTCGRRPGKNFLTACSIGRVRSRVRPIGAAGMAAGPNALRGTGPNRKPALRVR